MTFAMTAGCSGDDEGAAAPIAPTATSTAASYDATLAPSAAVLALVPTSTAAVAVTDFDRVRLQFGMTELTSDSTAKEVDAFWRAAGTDAPLLTTGMLRPESRVLGRTYGFTQIDVAWEAHLFDADGTETGYVLSFGYGADMGQVRAAVDAGVGPLAGASVDVADRLVTSGSAVDPAEGADGDTWADDPTLTALAGQQGDAAYLTRGCVAGDDDVRRLDPLDAYAVTLGTALATADLGAGRLDLFHRIELGSEVPAFADTFTDGVADPSTGRIGFMMSDPPRAADLVLRQQLPFAACSGR